MLNTVSISGNFTLGIYAEDCLFEDPTIKFRGMQKNANNTRIVPRSMHPYLPRTNFRIPLYSVGRSRYSQNLDLLVPFFDSPSLQLENIDKVSIFFAFPCSFALPN